MQIYFSEDEIVEKRIKEIKANPSIGKSEKELDDYLEKRGVKFDRTEKYIKGILN